MRFAGAWMTEKYFAATPLRCHNQFLKSIKLCCGRLRIALWHMVIQLKLKDFEGIHAPAYKNQLHLLGRRLFLYTVEVGGSKPSGPIIKINELHDL